MALVVVLAVLLTAGWLVAIGELTAFGPRAFYFLYLLAPSRQGGHDAFLRWPRLAGALLILALVDFGWGVGSYALRHSALGAASLLPTDKSEPQRFRWHALLQAVPIPSLRFTSAAGLAISHTSEGTRGKDPVPGELAVRNVVATFGGSTTSTISAPAKATPAEQVRLAAALEKGESKGRFFVINHGVPGYTTVEHLIPTEFYQIKFGKQPRCAIYYVGWNDLRNAHISNLDPAYADFHLPSQVNSLKVRRLSGSAPHYLAASYHGDAPDQRKFRHCPLLRRSLWPRAGGR